MRGFLLDLNRCTGCHACLLACSIENDLGEDKSWRQVYTFNLHRRVGVSRFHLSLGCLHCTDPACMRSCPAAAYSRHPYTGAVLINTGLCIGCKYCSWACPFDAPRYNHVTGTISKCTFCNDRLLEGRNPACTTLCPTGALQFAELPAQRAVDAVPGFPKTGIGPAMQFVPLRSAAAGPELSAAPDEHSATANLQTLEVAPVPKVTIESEWSLVFFSLATALLVAIASAAAAGSMQIGAPDFLIAALGAIGLSALHLGKWRRAWRGILNLRDSWLSREILLYLAFTGLTATMLFFPAGAPALAWPAVLSGFGGLFCIDRVYESVSCDKWLRLHSGRAVLTGLFLFGILAANPIISGLTGFLKLVLYSYRQSWFKSNARAMASVMRLGLGFVVPLAIWKVYPDWVLPSVLVAEVIDRCEYYLDLDIMTPQLGIALVPRRTT